MGQPGRGRAKIAKLSFLLNCTQSELSGLPRLLAARLASPLKTQAIETAVVPFLTFDLRDNMPLILGVNQATFFVVSTINKIEGTGVSGPLRIAKVQGGGQA
jgi:hypothetical protein